MIRRPIQLLSLALCALGFTAEPERAGLPVEVTLTEGTNMASALSPDGRTLAVDLIGRIWTLPAAGGTATPLTDPFGDARAPTWSPDGRRIAFQAYWSGDYDIWVVDADGAGLAQLTDGPFDDREPHWSPDGSRVAFSSDRGGTYDVWEVDVGTGAVVQLTEGADNEYNPAYGPRGQFLAYVSEGQQAGVWVRENAGASRRVVDLDGADGYAPSWSPDGTRIAYNRLADGRSYLHVAQSDGLGDLGQTLSDLDEDVFPFRASWTGDGRLLYTADGRVRSRPEAGGAARDVSLSATVTLERPPYRKRLRSFQPTGPRPVRGIVSPSMSPDGTTVAFTALGDLWTMRIGERPVQVTDDPFVEVDAMWSPDGTRLAYASDRDGATDVWIRDVATGAERKLTTDGGANPVWSPDGSEIAYLGGFGPTGGVRVVDVETGTVRTIRSGLNSPGRPSWSPDGRSVAVSALWTYSSRFREGVNRPLLLPASRSISEQDAEMPSPADAADAPNAQARFGGSGGAHDPPPPVLQEGERWLEFVPHGSLASRGTDGPVWSADGRKMAYVSSGVLWMVRVGPDGQPLGPPTRLNNELTADPTWDGASESVLYLTTNRLRRVWLASGRVEDVPVPLTWERRVPTVRLTVHAGALFDGVSEELHRNVDVVVEGQRIVRVAPHDMALHRGEVIDATDGVVSPGLIEMHMHGGLAMGESVGRQWLSYGVTSVRTPSADPYEMVEDRESYAVFRRIGPRTFGTGNTIDGSRIYYAGAPPLTASAQIDLSMARAEDLGFDLVKTYVRLSDAAQRRVIEDAHGLGMPVTSHELYPGVAYGVDGVEHVRGTSRRGYSTKVTQLNRSYQDVVELLARSGMTITPTVGIYGAYALLGVEDPTLFDDSRIPAFIGEGARRGGGGDVETRRRLVRSMASLGRRVLEAGGVVVVGTDAPINPQGLSLIAEMQALVEYGGMRPVDVMRATTSVPAEAMGYGSQIGSVRPGMLADLVVFGGDPLEDIRAVRDVRWVLRDGRPYSLEGLLEGPAR